MSPDEQKTVQAHCNTCVGERSHRVLARHDKCGTDPRTLDEWCDIYEVLECSGCTTVSFRHRFHPCTGWVADDEGPGYVYRGRLPKPFEERYPPSLSRALPRWMDRVPNLTKGLLQEVYTASAADARSLAAMGLRAIIDAVCNDRLGDIGEFDKKLKTLVDKGLVSPNDRDVLKVAVETGHAAAHRGHSPSANDVSKMLDIVEHLLESMYILQDAAEGLKNTTPTRKRAG